MYLTITKAIQYVYMLRYDYQWIPSVIK